MDILPYRAKRDFADVIGLRISRWQVIRDYLGGLDLITSIFLSGRQESQREKKKTRQQKQVKRMCFKNGGNRPRAKETKGNVGGGKGTKQSLPFGCPPLFLITSSTVKQWILFFWVMWAILLQIIKPKGCRNLDLQLVGQITGDNLRLAVDVGSGAAL